MLDEAHALAAEALSFHIEGMLADGAALPAPTPLERIMADLANRDGAAIVVPVHDVGSDSVRFDMSVDENTLSKIDDYAGKHGLTRTDFLIRAAQKAMRSDAL
jgi:HicB_like antitoxin of bacterial toxin-antitoxin system